MTGRIGWDDGLLLVQMISTAFGIAPVLTWIIAAYAPWELLMVGIAISALGIAGTVTGALAMRRDRIT